MLQSGMMYQPLLISSILTQAEINYPDTQIISRCQDTGIVEHSYKVLSERSKCLASALIDWGVVSGDRIATLAWNHHRHLEAYYAISGVAGVIHTVNPRLFDEQIIYMINHAEDRLLLVDPGFSELVARILPELSSVEKVIVLCEREAMPELLPDALCYEDLISDYPPIDTWPDFDETSAACLCYTSGTTGDPKGVLYSHRSTLLHALASSTPNGLNLSVDTRVMPVVPMYHVSAWGLPYSALLNGSTLILPGEGMDGASLYEMIDYGRADLLLGVPTVWLTLLAYLESKQLELETVSTVAVGGAAAPAALVESLEARGIYLMPLWGMTETSPLASFGRKTAAVTDMNPEQRRDVQCSAGKNIWGIEMLLHDSDGVPLERGTELSADLYVRGHWVVDHYFQREKEQAIPGWFDTGDVATIDSSGYLRIVDRKKDVIKSGGEWISSIDLENAALDDPAVAEACVVGVPHPKWDERPLLFVVLSNPERYVESDLIALLEQKVAKWWLPDAVLVVDELPHTATGKLQKNVLRERYRNYFDSLEC